ncbi:hypothetical protein NAPIS_ORF02098 [Vairimorpha apis BRL 01]|uniref:Uncharacterized protein n=1 Tax=Vairimorpha apis BRL 01 TaxID=1037528 RepID=T0MA93_9MICR|nr:hypothetical protein NAPIS_ORF02098 [Vairimorpha apis BRL 01]
MNNYYIFIDNLQQVEIEKLRKYDLLANKLGLIHECKTRIIPYLEISNRIKAYIQSNKKERNIRGEREERKRTSK